MTDNGNPQNTVEIELVYIIVNNGIGSKAVHIARHHGLSGGTVLVGKGTIASRLLDTLGLADSRKEIVLLLAKRTETFNIMEIMNRELRLHKPNHGIAFSIPIACVAGSKSFECITRKNTEEVDAPMYQSVFVIVDKGRGELAVDAAREAGSTGATIVNARGAGVHETSRLFAMDVEPEKEIVIIITKQEQTDRIVAALQKHLDIEKPGKGIVFVQNVKEVYGLYE